MHYMLFTNLKLAILIHFNLCYFLPDVNIPTPTFVYLALTFPSVLHIPELGQLMVLLQQITSLTQLHYFLGPQFPLIYSDFLSIYQPNLSYLHFSWIPDHHFISQKWLYLSLLLFLKIKFGGFCYYAKYKCSCSHSD